MHGIKANKTHSCKLQLYNSDALYALIKMISKEKEAADSEDEWSFEASVTKDPYYSYN